MGKQLSELTLEELWELFPIVLKEYCPAYLKWYEEEKEAVLKSIGKSNVFRIHHIGSTAVEGLLSKPTIDILLEGKDESAVGQIKQTLLCSGWTCMSEQAAPEVKIVLNKGYTPDGFAKKVFHLHLRCPGDWGELYFRDLLRARPEIAEEYGELKKKLQKEFEHDRDGYTRAKSSFVQKYTAFARTQFPDRYRLDKI